ncbi:helix-turn-helix domain-containing protein [Flavilitoribacter nigricans]|uniref:HTH araC/xylS-type domain-containing protein n=1 Tax=Flavilitoribacter nigricans (strain ATCC 23147 / DSM 23189 / NBRC 102662 / NCIMB 1420 / SS-2) TaxID=1122177 RepID=A0A2D0NG14_FLAN2|nr:helix-turn-helix domain-containing protein [Flavilitoribacter nigricans]PHN07425.1 hypothetical protein CRP01_07290 [Flavilitoribacter nigricans DSM 23189 = NBRC 102662]
MQEQEKSVAVLPFVNISSDRDNEYFSDGITEEIINALTRVKGLKVTARTSSFVFKGKHIDVRRIGEQLGVRTLLEGSVRRFRNRVRIAAQLIRAADGFRLWTKSFDREMVDIFDLQDEISLLIAEQIREHFGHLDIQDQLVQAPTQDIEAYQLYLKGRSFQLQWSNVNYPRAIEYYEKSIQLDARNPLPYYGLIRCHAYLTSWNITPLAEGRRQTAQYLQIVSQLKNDWPDYYLAAATCSILLDWDVAQGMEQLDKTLAIQPNHSEVLEAKAGLLITQGRFAEALECIDRALVVNPLSANHIFMKGNILFFAGDHTTSNEYMDRVQELDPNWQLALQVKAANLILLKEPDALNSLLEKHRDKSFAPYYQLLYDRYHGIDRSPVADSPELDGGFRPWRVYFDLYAGKKEAVMQQLREGIAGRHGRFFTLFHDPFLAPLRDDPAFAALEKTAFGDMPNQTSTPPPAEDVPKMDEEEIARYRQLLSELLAGEYPYLDPALSLKDLAEMLSLHPNKLSWFLNEQIGKNFNEYINGFRLEAFCEKAKDPSNAHLTILGLAYESGFNSKTVFNAFFKKHMGRTPSAWLNAQKQAR